jgi:N-acetylglucosamine-6-phosphate deacetylase
MIRAKGFSNSILVSDVAAPGGLAPGTYQQYIGGNVVLGEDGRLSIEGTPYLAGAARPLPDCVATAVTMAGISLADALSLATTNPGRFIGRSGRLAVGEPADIIAFDWEPGQKSLDIHQVVIGGDPGI